MWQSKRFRFARLKRACAERQATRPEVVRRGSNGSARETLAQV